MGASEAMMPLFTCARHYENLGRLNFLVNAEEDPVPLAFLRPTFRQHTVTEESPA